MTEPSLDNQGGGGAVEASRFGRSGTSRARPLVLEIDKVLLLLLAVLIAIGLVAVAAASPAAGQRYRAARAQFSGSIISMA